MKQILIIAISVSCLMLSGCKEKECTGCCDEKYAPAGVTVSWTGYNDVMTFRKYFKCHPETIRQHAEAQDTIKVMGYIYYGNPDAEEMCWSEYGFLNGSDNGFCVTSKSDHTGQKSTIWAAIVDSTALLQFRKHYYEYENKLLYMAGTLSYIDYTGVGGCCYRSENYDVFQIDTIPN